MKRVIKCVVLTLLLTLSSTALRAQLFYMDDDEKAQGNRGAAENVGQIPVLPQNGTNDWNAPLGEGVVALALLGGGYLLTKRKKDREC
jgi:LPXTG-motif cell wall-anchored protein